MAYNPPPDDYFQGFTNMSEFLLHVHKNFDESQLEPKEGTRELFRKIEPTEIENILFETHGWMRKRARIAEAIEALREASGLPINPDWICADLKDEMRLYLFSDRNPAGILYSDMTRWYELDERRKPMLKVGYRPHSPASVLGVQLFQLLHSWTPEDEIAD